MVLLCYLFSDEACQVGFPVVRRHPLDAGRVTFSGYSWDHLAWPPRVHLGSRGDARGFLGIPEGRSTRIPPTILEGGWGRRLSQAYVAG